MDTHTLEQEGWVARTLGARATTATTNTGRRVKALLVPRRKVFDPKTQTASSRASLQICCLLHLRRPFSSCQLDCTIDLFQLNPPICSDWCPFRPVPAETMASSDTDTAHQGAWAYIKSLYQAIRDEFEDEDGRPVELEYQRMNTSVRRLGMLPPVNTLTFKKLARSTLTQHLPRTFSLGPNPRVYRSRKCTNLRVALTQATGHVSGAADECDRCSQGYGLWVGCVRAPDGFPNGMLPDCCANCLYNDQIHRCTPGPARKIITVSPASSSDANSHVAPPPRP